MVDDKLDFLDKLLEGAGVETLRELVRQLVRTAPDVRRECVEFLKEQVVLAPGDQAKAHVEAVFLLWAELEPDLGELDQYGGGDYGLVDHVEGLLYDLAKRLKAEALPDDDRAGLLDEVLEYVRSGNAGMDDALHEVVYAASRTDAHLRDLAERFEAIGRDWPTDHARRIYRQLGDNDKYLELRLRKMKYGLDYHDLAIFYWEQGDKNKALEVAREGLKTAIGRMTELREFLAKRAKRAGNREEYLALQFAQATDRLDLTSYKKFRKLCTEDEWLRFEPRMLNILRETYVMERIPILLHRYDHEGSLSALLDAGCPNGHMGSMYGDNTLGFARNLEKRFPEEILEFYRSGLGNPDWTASRKVYAFKAGLVKRMRRLWLQELNQPEAWRRFAREIKSRNARRPAFQEEFAKVVPSWKDL